MIPLYSIPLLVATSGEAEYVRGMALAREQRWIEAAHAFRAGRRRAPYDKRFPIELAGIAFKQRDYRRAKASLHEALRLDRRDAYANSFLATLYSLDGNLEAALKYWNRAGKPRIERIHTGGVDMDPVLLDRAFAFSPAAVLRLDEYRRTEAHLRLLGSFRTWRFELEPNQETFDLAFHAVERDPGWLALLRGLAFETVHPELYNLGGRGAHLLSLLRWDADKRRAYAALSMPLAGDPATRWIVFLDGRRENWLGDFTMDRIEGGFSLDRVTAGAWSWSARAAVSNRRFRGGAHQGGTLVKSAAGIEYPLWRAPERRFSLVSGGSGEFGRMRDNRFARFQGSLAARWLPRARGDDFETVVRIRTGKTLGTVPFDELFSLGVERDNDLWLRAHPGTRGGRKGSAPMGRHYVVVNWETDKIVLHRGGVALRVGPFLDTGRVLGSVERQRWLWDAGVQAKLGILGRVALALSYGRDLGAGRNAFYALSR